MHKCYDFTSINSKIICNSSKTFLKQVSIIIDEYSKFVICNFQIDKKLLMMDREH